jgi:hypothetical protein
VQFADSMFRGFSGADPRILISQESFATFHACTFEDINLRTEVFDVSFGGLVRLEDCMFRNVQTPKLVSTTLNDAASCEKFHYDLRNAYRYQPQDDELYDIQKEELPGRPGEYVVKNETLSDCLRPYFQCKDLFYRQGAPIPLPGCPDQSVQRRYGLDISRCQDDYILEHSPPNLNVPYDYYYGIEPDYSPAANETAHPSPDPADAPYAYADYSPESVGDGYGHCYEYPYLRGESGYRFGFPSEDHNWLRHLRQVRASAPKRPLQLHLRQLQTA